MKIYTLRDFQKIIDSKKSNDFPRLYQRVIKNTLLNTKLPIDISNFLWGITYSDCTGYQDLYPEFTIAYTSIKSSIRNSIKEIINFGRMVRELEDPNYKLPQVSVEVLEELVR